MICLEPLRPLVERNMIFSIMFLQRQTLNIEHLTVGKPLYLQTRLKHHQPLLKEEDRSLHLFFYMLIVPRNRV